MNRQDINGEINNCFCGSSHLNIITAIEPLQKSLTVGNRNYSGHTANAGSSGLDTEVQNAGEVSVNLPSVSCLESSKTTSASSSIENVSFLEKNMLSLKVDMALSENPNFNQLSGLVSDKTSDTSALLPAGLRITQGGDQLNPQTLAGLNGNPEREAISLCSDLESICMQSLIESGILENGADTRTEYKDTATDHLTIQSIVDDSIPISEADNDVNTDINSQNSNVTESDSNKNDEKPKRAISVLDQGSNKACSETCPEPKVKRRRRREKNPDPIPNVPILPPCKICDEKSTGYHYGAYTCEACKGFFRRTLKKTDIAFECRCTESDRLAWQLGPHKNGCQACRYERCLEVGMSKSASKIGRYTLDRKTDNIREVKSLEAIDAIIEETMLSSVSSTRSPSSAGTEYTRVEGLTAPDGRMSSILDSPCCSNLLEVIHCSESALRYPSVEEIEAIIRDMTQAHISRTAIASHLLNCPREEIDRRHKKYMEEYNLKQSVFGRLTPLSREEYREFFQATGIDIDGRQAFLEEALEHNSKKVVQFKEFARTIPGFNELSIKDQRRLIKYSNYEHMLVSSYRVILKHLSSDLIVYTTPWGREIHIPSMTWMVPRSLMETRYMICKRLESLKLSIEEEAILRGIVLTFSDRCVMDNPEAVQNVQETLIACLEHLFSLRQKSVKQPLYKVIDTLVKFREFSERHRNIFRELILESPCISNCRCALLKEIIE